MNVPASTAPRAWPLIAGATCLDDPTYVAAGWSCSSWAGWDCRNGYGSFSDPAAVATLVASCPQSCNDVTPLCDPQPPPSPPEIVLLLPDHLIPSPPSAPEIHGEHVRCIYGEEVCTNPAFPMPRAVTTPSAIV